MTLTQNQITNIADDAVNLHDALMTRGVPKNAAYTWVASAMLAIVMHETEDAPETPEPEMFVYDSGKWPTPEQEAAKQARLAREQARRGNVTGDLGGLHPGTLEQLAHGPKTAGTEMRLVAMPEERSQLEHQPGVARTWVRDNVPEAGTILSSTYSGKDEAGKPVYLVTYELRDDPPQRHTEFSSLNDD